MSYFASAAHAEEFRHKLLREYEGEYEVLTAFVEVFTERSLGLMQDARSAFGQKNQEKFTLLIHSLKGSLSQLYLDELTDLALKIERSTKQSGLTQSVLVDFEQLEGELIKLNDWLTEHFLGVPNS